MRQAPVDTTDQHRNADLVDGDGIRRGVQLLAGRHPFSDGLMILLRCFRRSIRTEEEIFAVQDGVSLPGGLVVAELRYSGFTPLVLRFVFSRCLFWG